MPRFFSQRMLNPFHGIVNVVEIEGADAVCRNGCTWTLYIQGGTETERDGDGEERAVPLPDIRFGTWSRSAGLKRGPVRYVTDYERLDRIGGRLLEAVKSRAERVPFPHDDRFELWLLEAGSLRPLALLRSACGQEETRTDNLETLLWTPGQAARESFRLDGNAAAESGDAERLAQLVRRAAGEQPAAQWFERMRDGSGSGLGCGLDLPGLPGRRLPQTAFPELLLRSDWTSPGDTALVAGFHAWQAPWLLALQTLARDTRRRLEIAARRRALMMDQLYATYPEIIDPGVLKAARVEAALRRPAEDRGAEDPTRTPFFVTGN